MIFLIFIIQCLILKIRNRIIKIKNFILLDDSKFNGEGRTITIEFPKFYLVACYVPNSGDGLQRLNFRVNEW